MLEEYRLAMVRRNLRPGSIYARMGEVRRWMAWCARNEVDWSRAAWRHVEMALGERPLGARAMASNISHLHKFYQWAQRNELTHIDPTELVERPKLTVGAPRPMPEVYVDLALAQSSGVMHTMISLMAWAGMRCFEVSVLTWADVDLEARTLHVVGKGLRERDIAIAPKLLEHLASLDGTEGLVVGKQYTACRVSQMVNQFLKSNGIQRPFTAHSLRHRKGTHLYEQTGDVMVVQLYLGHASVATTQGYVKVAQARMMALTAMID
ncbi:MAG: site-specific tyrosine recombinase XerD [Ilumatobacteraceae bacterium]|nr:site-specific tyrosine recombinase XerD [Ilumatobacteraceae bacterium]